ncbi:MAG: response regulator, partial [Treponema sp.]|nr:response regulator [Treponema sp.]
MYSVLIVDDEEPVLESYEYMLNTFSDGEEKKPPFTLAGKARTGFEALRLIHETKPDLVFMDINIPGMDGLAVLEDVCKKYPRMVCVLSTAYERFDLVRRAMPLRVFAYLVKPVSKNIFFSTLENALVKLYSMQPENSEYNDPRLVLLRRDIWTAMDERRWSWYRETLALPSDHGFVMFVEMEKDIEIWGARIAEQISFKNHCTFDVLLNRAIFLISEDLNPELFRKKNIKLLEKPPDNITMYFGIGGCYRGTELYRSC